MLFVCFRKSFINPKLLAKIDKTLPMAVFLNEFCKKKIVYCKPVPNQNLYLH